MAINRTDFTRGERAALIASLKYALSGSEPSEHVIELIIEGPHTAGADDVVLRLLAKTMRSALEKLETAIPIEREHKPRGRGRRVA